MCTCFWYFPTKYKRNSLKKPNKQTCLFCVLDGVGLWVHGRQPLHILMASIFHRAYDMKPGTSTVCLQTCFFHRNWHLWQNSVNFLRFTNRATHRKLVFFIIKHVYRHARILFTLMLMSNHFHAWRFQGDNQSYSVGFAYRYVAFQMILSGIIEYACEPNCVRVVHVRGSRSIR